MVQAKEVNADTGRNRRSYTPVEFSGSGPSGRRFESTDVEPRAKYGRRRRSHTPLELLGTRQGSHLELEEVPRDPHGRRRRSDTPVEFWGPNSSRSELEEQNIQDGMGGPPSGPSGLHRMN